MSELKRRLVEPWVNARDDDFEELCEDDSKFVTMNEDQFLRYLHSRGLTERPAIAGLPIADSALVSTGDEATEENDVTELLQLDFFDLFDQ